LRSKIRTRRVRQLCCQCASTLLSAKVWYRFNLVTSVRLANTAGNLASPLLFFAQDPNRLSKTARAAVLLLWHAGSMHKIASDLGRPMPFLYSYLGTPLDLFSIWLATQNSFGAPEQSAPEDVSSEEPVANGCSLSGLCDQLKHEKSHVNSICTRICSFESKRGRFAKGEI
jgi:hypothetical protein